MSVTRTTPSAPAAPAGPPRPRNRRTTEAVLLFVAVVVGIAGYVAVGLGYDGEVPADTLTVTIGAAILFLLAHVAVRRYAPYADPVLLPCVAFLNLFGLVLIHRLDLVAHDAAVQAGRTPPSADSVSQLVWTTLGVALFIAVLVVVRDHRMLQRFTYTALFAGIVLLLLPLLPVVGTSINGARLWLRVGGLSFQPGEVAKLCFILFFAGYLVVKRDVLALARTRVMGVDLPRGRDLGPLFVAWGASMAVLVFERDLGSALLFFGLFVAMLYIATGRRSWLILGGLLFVAGAYVAYQVFSHVQTRIDIWLNPFEFANTGGYQIVQSLYGLASGGMLGTGLGVGHPEFVPFAKTDFIVAAAGEELGLAGLIALLMVYAIVVERGLRTAVTARDPYGTLLAAGLSITLGLQVFVVVGGVTKLIPLTGLTTPFLSYGGSSLVANWVLIALLLRISDAGRRPSPAPAPALDDAPTQVVRL